MNQTTHTDTMQHSAQQPAFLQVTENRKKSGNLSGQGKQGGGNIFLGKVRENEKNGATRCHIFRLKCIKFDFRRPPPLAPCWGSLQLSSRSCT